MGKTLYLNESDIPISLHADGPSLLIKLPHSAERRIPLRVLGRVIIFGNIRIDADALTLLGMHNIPAIFISKKARSLSVSLPFQYTYPSYSIKVRLLLKDQKKVEEFFEWARAKRSFLKTAVIKRLYHGPRISPDNYREILSFLIPEDREEWFKVKYIVKALFWSLIIEELIARKLDPHCGVINRRNSFGLVMDFTYIVGPEIDFQTLQFFKSDSIDKFINSVNNSCLLTARGIQNIVNRFENKQYIVRKIIKDIADKLYELMERGDEKKLSCLL